MQSEDRPIHFSTELVFPPRQFEKPVLQKFYFELGQTSGLEYDNSQFGGQALAKFFTQRGKKAQSALLIIPDRVAIVEEWVDMPFSEFLAKIGAVSELARTELGVEEIQSQTVMVRTTFGLSHFEDNREFLLDHVCNQEGKIAQFFGRPIATGSLRFVLPATPEHEGTLYITVEPFRGSKRELFVEVRGVFSSQHSTLEEVSDFTSKAIRCRDFISDNLYPYLNQYDVPRD
jgi:hypothetical protein